MLIKVVVHETNKRLRHPRQNFQRGRRNDVAVQPVKKTSAISSGLCEYSDRHLVDRFVGKADNHPTLSTLSRGFSLVAQRVERHPGNKSARPMHNYCTVINSKISTFLVQVNGRNFLRSSTKEKKKKQHWLQKFFICNIFHCR